MAKTKKVIKIYFDSKGDMLLRAAYWLTNPNPNPNAPVIKSEDNHVFKDQLQYEGYYDNHIKMKSIQSGRLYYMFLADFDDMMKEKIMIQNVVNGEFTFRKRGTTQGVRLIIKRAP